MTPDPVTARIIAMRSEGATFAAIASEIGMSRNTVIGKAHRYLVKTGQRVMRQVPQSQTVQKRQYRRTVTPVTQAGKADLAKPLPAVKRATVAYVPGIPCGIIDVTGCKWPVGTDPATAGTHLFCNADCHGEGSYCEHHAIASADPWSREAIRKTIKSAAFINRGAR